MKDGQKAAKAVSEARALAARSSPPDAAEFRADLEAALAALDSEPAALRPPDRKGRPGGLVCLPRLSTLIVPDLHARGQLLATLLDAKLPGSGAARVADLLAAGELVLLCLGDILHSEGPQAAARWAQAAEGFVQGYSGGEENPAMDLEMSLALSCLQIVFRLKAAFPRHVHCLKGNHDNLGNIEGNGDFSFRKYAMEGAMSAAWFSERYGRELLERVREYELALPVAACGEDFCASHAEPAFAVDTESLVSYRARPDIVAALIWTDNDEAEADSVRDSLENLLGPGRADALWFSGHRYVHGGVGLRAQGRLVQLHDPTENRALLLRPAARRGGKSPAFDIELIRLAAPGVRKGGLVSESLHIDPAGSGD
ncbi:MAG: hypothetical protein ABFC75_03100 [Rectinema sp.]